MQFKKYLTGWYRTIVFAAPKEMEHIETNYKSNDCQSLEPFRAIFKQIYNLRESQRADLQLPRDGVGRIYHRRYAIRVNSNFSAEELMRRIQHNPNRFCDPQLAEIKKVDGEFRPMVVGDDYHIAISGPWDGPVRTVSVDETSFVFATRQNHLEAGLIRFCVQPTGHQELTFSIESWATSSGMLVWFTYSIIGISKKMQTKMWRYFCLKVAQEAGGEMIGDLEINTCQMNQTGDDDAI